MDYDRFLQRLYAQNQFAIKYDLEAMRHAVAAMELERVCPRVVLVGGTNGKGSTCAALASMARSLGWRTGVYTSPHLIDFRERIRIVGRPMERENLLSLGSGILTRFCGQDAPAEGPRPLTFFELTTLMALAAFKDAEPPLDLVILEVGMGGRLDAVNAVERDLVLLTGVAMDHQEYLGDTIEAIAREKAGLALAGSRVLVCSAAAGSALLAAECRSNGATVDTISVPEESTPSELAKALAGSALRQLAGARHPVRDLEAAIAEGGARFRWPGRQERRSWQGREVLIDGAHNAQSAEACAAWLARLGHGRERRVQVLTGLSGQRRAEDVLAPLLPFASRWQVTEPVARPAPAERIARELEELGAKDVTLHRGARAALEAAGTHEEPILVVGSLYLVGDVLTAMGLKAEDLLLWSSAVAEAPGAVQRRVP